MKRVEVLLPLILLLGLVAALVAPAVDAGEPVTGRLSRQVEPASETINLVLDPGKEDYQGSVKIALRVKEPTRGFRFHAEGLTLQEVTLEGPAGRIEVSHKEAGPMGLVAIESASPLAVGKYALAVRFNGKLATNSIGIYRLESDGASYIFTQFEAPHARKAFPCWDEPSFKIPYQITLEVPAENIAVSNTPVERESVAEGRRTVVFYRTKPLPSYLLAIAAGPLEVVPIPDMNVPASIVTVKGRAALAAEAVEMTPKILAALEKEFGRPYPFEKLDLIAVPEAATFGAMEHPGAVTFAEAFLLLDSATMTTEDRRRVATTIAHELAHMWFGDFVTMAWWDDLWLNESFASWMGDKVSDHLYPELGLQVSEVRTTQQAMAVDSLLNTGAIRKPIESADITFGSDLGLAYSKGPAVLEMVEGWIGEKAFHKGITDYLEAHAWDNATGADLWTALSRASGRDVGGMLTSFLDQAGVPVVQVEFIAGGGVRLTQKRFLAYGVTAPTTSRWRIPVEIRWGDAGGTHERSVLLGDKAAVMKLGTKGTPDWIHPNAGEKGYYRWTLPQSALEKLVSEAPERLSPRERVGLAFNLSALLRAGKLHGDGFLKLLGQLSSDEDPEVVSAVIELLSGVKGAFVQAEMEESFAAYVRATLGPSLKRIGTTRAPRETEKVAELRQELLGWLGEHGRDPGVLELARSMAGKYLESPASVDPELAGTALRLAALDGGRDLYENYRKHFESAKNPDDRFRFLTALGSFRDEKLFDEALSYSLSGSLHVQEIFAAPFAGSTSEVRRDRVFRWLTENYATLASRLPPESLSFLPYGAGGCSTQRLEQAEKFFAEPAHSPPGTGQEMAKVAEGVKQCVALRQREGASVAEFFRTLSPSASR